MLNVDITTTGNADFLNYMLKKSTYAAFNMPNFKQKGFAEKIKVNKEFLQYSERCNSILETINDTLVRRYVSKSFFDAKYKHVLDIYIFRVKKAFRNEVTMKGALSNWIFPELPEDLCLFDEKGNCILFCQSHEKICEIYGETEKELECFRLWGCQF